MGRLMSALLRLPFVILATFLGQQRARRRRQDYIAGIRSANGMRAHGR